MIFLVGFCLYYLSRRERSSDEEIEEFIENEFLKEFEED